MNASTEVRTAQNSTTLLLLPLPSLAFPSCGSAPAAAALSPGRVGGGAILSAVPSALCFPPHSASKEEIKNNNKGSQQRHAEII